AAYAALSAHAAIAAGASTISGPAPSMAAADQSISQRALPQPRNFDASLVGESAKASTFGAAKPQLAMPEVINSGLRYTRTKPAGGLSTHYSEQLDRPTFIWAGNNAGKGLDFYAYKRGEGALSYAPAYLKQFASRLKIAPSAIDHAELVFLHDDGEGPVIARYQQRVNGLEVMNRQLNVVMNQNLELIAISGYFATAKAARNKDFSDAFRGGPTAAMNATFNDLGIGVSAYNLYDTNQTKGGFAQFAPTAGSTSLNKAAGGVQLTAPVGAKKVLFPVDGELVPGYMMLVRAGQIGSQNSLAYSYVASADGNRVLYRKNLVAHDSYQYRVFADATTKRPDDSPFGNGLVPFPGSFPLTKTFGSGTLVTVADATQGITDAWLPATIAAPPGFPGAGPLFVPATQTTFGNNVYAYADVGGADGPEEGVDVFAATTAAGAFDYTIDFTQQPDATTDNQQAAIVNLFYLNNWLHDAWYNAGFTEVTGNAQYDNYGRGGLEDTYIVAEAQDFSGRNNANMATGPDGTFTRMQMYIFDGPIASQTTQATSSGGTGPFVFDPAAPSSFGAKEFDITADVAIYNDGDTSGTGINGEFDACQATTQDLTGKIALIADIYTCNFTVKIKNAQNAGAIGALVVYNGAPNPDQVFAMGGSDPTVTIPALGVSDDDANPVIADIGAGNIVTLHMQLDLAPDRDGSLDSQVVAHEFFHYTSNRLVGDASGLSNLQGGGMGEGWSDMAGLLLSVRKDDLVNQPAGFYTIGGYDVDDFLYGIRRLPYTTNIAANPFTFGDLGLAPRVHAVGEIWVLPLWEAYVAMFQHYYSVDPATAFEVAKSKMMNYIIEGLMITPNAPTMLEARDAILISALATSETDYDIFVEAFAKRGMGFGAIAPPRTSTTLAAVTESFKTELKVYSLSNAAIDTNYAAGTCDADGTLDPNETGQMTIVISNDGSADLNGVTAQLSSTADVTFANGGVVTFETLPR
ncbi:MAG TPA: M36 family metallopeptidase, partial [Gammaproteobacteria bacterium]|nr:M36 family metallopeptidase [Gammaproteobacteria bacterium]